MHQKQPPANVATAMPGGTAGAGAASDRDAATSAAAKSVNVRIMGSSEKWSGSNESGGMLPDYAPSHSHAAPRTPLESPWTGGSRRVATASENTCARHSSGTRR